MISLLRPLTRVATLGCIGFAFAAYAVPGQPGTLDETFGTSGIVTTAIGGGNDNAQAVAVQPDGKLLVAGGCFTGTTYDFCLARYSPAGVLDITFGTGGKVITAIGSNYSNATTLALQPDGKIIIAGQCFNINSDFCLARYNSVGALDTTFGASGKVFTAIGSKDAGASALALQPDGKIIVAGSCRGPVNEDFCLVRYDTVGAPDIAFGTDGKVITAVGNGTDIAHDLALQADGKIVLAGHCQGAINNDFCIARYSDAGTLDTSFGLGGTVITAVGSSEDYVWALAVQLDGKIVVAGNCYGGISSSFDFCLARYTAIGALDPSFATGGKVTSPIGNGTDYVRALSLQPDGKIVAAGYCISIKTSFCVARYTTAGALDMTFGTLGKVVTAVGSRDDQAFALALQSDGKLVVAGTCDTGGNYDFCVVRYDGGPNTPKTLVEYVYSPLNYYFLTSRDTDKALLDTTPGWAPTGQSFSSLSFADPGSVGITRYYFDQVAKNQTRGSHFYTLVDSEKTALAGLNPTNQPLPRLPYNEGVDSYAFPPVVEGVGGRCAAGQTPIYRAFRGQLRFPDDPNHRFTSSLTLYNQLVAQGWDGEGVKMCAPN